MVNIKKHILHLSYLTILLLSCKAHKKVTSATTPVNKGIEQPVIVKPNDEKYKYNTNTITKTENLTLEDFNAIATQSRIVIIDFNAVWCGPCRRLTPILEQLETEYSNKIKVIKIDVDKNRFISNYFRIESIPLLHFYKDGKLVNQIEGLPCKANLKYAIEKLIK